MTQIRQDLETMMQAVETMLPLALGLETVLLLIGSVFYEVVIKAL